MLDTFLLIALIMLALSVVGCLIRVLKGPSLPDRIIALDTIGIQMLGIVAVLSMMLHTQVFLDVILLIGILAFLGTVAFAKYLEKGVVMTDERD